MELQIMANNIAAQMREKMEKLESVVMAIDNLASLAPSIDGNNAIEFANLTHFLSTELSCQFEGLNRDLKTRVLPFVADITALKTA
jgi:hypothetical protein